MGAAMMRFGSNLDLTPALSGLIVVALLVFGAVVIQVAGSAERGGRVATTVERNEVRTRTTPAENGDQVTPDIGVADLRGSLP